MLNELKGNAWDLHQQGWMLCITTNGTIQEMQVPKKQGELFKQTVYRCVTGAGIAQEATERFGDFPYQVGRMIYQYGNHAFLLRDHLISFPVKHNWWEKADPVLITRSMHELYLLMRAYDFKNVVLPRPGCGNGKLSWEKDVRPLLSSITNKWKENIAARLVVISDMRVERELANADQ